MIIHAWVDYKKQNLVVISHDGSIDTKPLVKPYFYAIVPRTKAKVLEILLHGEDVYIEPDDRIPLVYNGTRYVEDPEYTVYRIYVSSPTIVPRLSTFLASQGIRVSAFNVRYIVRNCFDNNIAFFDVIPLYYGFDERIIDKIARVKGVIIDIETVEGRPVLASLVEYHPFKEVKREEVISLDLPEEMDELERILAKYPVVLGHNIIGFDIPVLERSGVAIDKNNKLLFDTSVVLSTYGSSLGVGSARSLLDVAMVLKEEVGITDEEIDIKKRVRGRVERLNREELVRYNANDVVLTAKILNSISPFILAVSAITQIPPTEVMQLPPGMVAEYSLLRYMELQGYIPEYRPSGARLAGERVYCVGEGKTFTNVIHVDIKAMYPNYVLHHYIDPTLHVGNREFDRRAGIGLLYAFVKRLYNIRLMTKALKKKDPRFDPVDKGVKAILNALAFGVQGKTSGSAIMGNPYCPEKIFYSTRDIQFKTIEYLQKKGIKVIYSDTDSFFMISDKPVDEVVRAVNEFLKQYGLEADLEDVWDMMYIYGKKNYVLKKGDKLIVKGGALINLDRLYLPECISLYQLLRIEDKRERLKYVREVIESSPIEDLFFRGHQQVWRLISKDIQSWKRLGDKKERYIVALTPWSEKPTVILKKGHLSHFMLPHSAPIFLFFLDGRQEIDVAELNPFAIVELRSIRLYNDFARLKAKYGDYDLLVMTDETYLLRIDGLYYGLRLGGERRYLPVTYDASVKRLGRPFLETLKADIMVRKVDVDENILRRLVFEYTKKILKSYKII